MTEEETGVLLRPKNWINGKLEEERFPFVMTWGSLLFLVVAWLVKMIDLGETPTPNEYLYFLYQEELSLLVWFLFPAMLGFLKNRNLSYNAELSSGTLPWVLPYAFFFSAFAPITFHLMEIPGILAEVNTAYLEPLDRFSLRPYITTIAFFIGIFASATLRGNLYPNIFAEEKKL